MIKRYNVTGGHHVMPDKNGEFCLFIDVAWHQRIKKLWVEDDACLGQNFEEHGHESACHAWARVFPDAGPWRQPIRGERHYLEMFDGGDWCAYLLEGGRVYISACDGEALGIVVTE